MDCIWMWTTFMDIIIGGQTGSPLFGIQQRSHQL